MFDGLIIRQSCSTPTDPQVWLSLSAIECQHMLYTRNKQTFSKEKNIRCNLMQFLSIINMKSHFYLGRCMDLFFFFYQNNIMLPFDKSPQIITPLNEQHESCSYFPLSLSLTSVQQVCVQEEKYTEYPKIKWQNILPPEK